MADNPFGNPLEKVTEDMERRAQSGPELPEWEVPDFEPAQSRTTPSRTAPEYSAPTGDLMPPPEMQSVFVDVARRYGVPVNILAALAQQESNYNPMALGEPTEWGRAKGMMQYLDETAEGVGINPFDPQQAIAGAARQLRERLDKGYSMDEAVMEHFAGPDRGKWGPKTDAYGREVLGKAVRIAEQWGGQLQSQPSVAEEGGQEQAPSPLTLENQERYEQGMPLVDSAATDVITAATQKAEEYDSFLGATGKALGNVPERFMQSIGGLVQLAGEDMAAGRERHIAESAARMGISPGDYKLIAWAGENGLVDKDMGGREALAYIKKNIAQALNPEQLQQLYSAGILNPDEIAQYGEELRSEAASTMDPVNAEPGSMAYYGSAAIGSFAEMTPMLLATVLTRNPRVGMGIMAGQVGGQSYGEGRDEGLSPDDAQLYATLQAAAEAIPEGMVLERLLRPGKNVFSKIFKGAVAEGAQEVVTAALQSGIDKGMISPDMTWAEARQRMVDGGIIGALTGGGMGATVAGAEAVLGRGGRKKGPPGGEQPAAQPQQDAPAAEPVAQEPVPDPVQEPAPVPQDPAGPIQSAVKTTQQMTAAAAQPDEQVTVQTPAGPIAGIVQSFEETPQGGFTLRMMDENGQLREFTEKDATAVIGADGAPIVEAEAEAEAEQEQGQPEPQERAFDDPIDDGELDAILDKAIAGGGVGRIDETGARIEDDPAPADQATPEAEPEPDQVPRRSADDLEALSTPDLRKELKAVKARIKDQGDSPELDSLRREIERAINGRNKQAEAPAAEAQPATAAPTVEQPTPAPVPLPEGYQGRRDGSPFRNETVARNAIKNRDLQGYEAVEVDGGWALAPVSDGQTTTPQTPGTVPATGEVASWVIRDKDSGEVVMETFDKAKVNALNTSRYEAVPIQEYLGSLNRQEEPAAPGPAQQKKERPTPAQARKQRQERAKQQARDTIGVDEGGTVRLSDNVGYAGAGEAYQVESIGGDGTVTVRNTETGGRTTLSRSELAAARRRGVAFEPVESEPEAAETAEREAAPDPSGQPQEQETPPGRREPSANTLVTEDRAAELRKRLKSKLNQLNAGIDPEILAIGTELAVFHVERGARRFAAFARAMADDLGTSIENIRPYLRGWYNGARDMMEDMGANIDGMDDAGSVRAQLRTLTDEGAARTEGDTITVTVGDERIPARFEVVEASEVQATMGKAANQYRDRSRAGSDVQISSIANNLDFDQLGRSPVMDYGSPTLAQDGTVIGGNGRLAAINMAYDRGTANGYRQGLQESAGEFGINPEAVAAMERPVLVRRFTQDVDVNRLAVASNEGGGLRMSALEQAKVDAERMGEMSDFTPGENGEIVTARNMPFIRRFIGEMPVNQQSAFTDADGNLSQEGIQRVRNAVLYRAYGDSPVLSRLVESADPGLRNVSNALVLSAPTVAEVRAGIAAGAYHDLDIMDDLIAAVEAMNKLRQDRQSVMDYLDQMGLFGDGLSDTAADLLRFLDENARRAKAIAGMIEDHYRGIRALGSPDQGDIFGAEAPNRQEVLSDAIERNRRTEGPQSGDLFGTDPATGQPGGQQPDDAEAGAGDPGQAGPEEGLGDTDATGSRAGVERDSGQRAAGAPADEAVVQSEPGTDGPVAGRAGGPAEPSRASGRGGQRLPADGAAARGERSDQPVHQQDGQFQPTPGAARGAERAGSGGDRGARPPVEQKRAADIARSAPTPGAGELNSRLKAQQEAGTVPTAWGDSSNIDQALPLLLPAQRGDVLKAEQRFQSGGLGMLFTNGTGTGKTATGLGIAKRFHNNGQTNIAVVVPTDKIASDWVKFADMLGMPLKQLTGTQDNGGSGPVITTYANFGQNPTLVDRSWDAIIPDESHYLSSNEAGDSTRALEMLRALTGHHAGFNTYMENRHRDLYTRVQAANEARAAANANQDISEAQYARLEREAADLNTEWRRLLDQHRPGWEARWASQQGLAKAVFLSATPWPYVKNVEYAEGFLFNFVPPAEQFNRESRGRGYNEGGAREQFYMANFGYRMRYNKLTQPEAGVNSAVMEQQFNQRLQDEGALSGRRLDVDHDYSRRFVMVEDAVGTKIDDGLRWLREEGDGRYQPLYDFVSKKFDYQQRMYLLEAIKAKHAVPQIKQHLALGRKVVVFHDFNKGGGFHPFKLPRRPNVNVTIRTITEDGTLGSEEVPWDKLVQAFENNRPDLVNLDMSGLNSPIATMQREFPDALFFNGTVPKGDRKRNADLFNDDNSGRNLIVVQSDAGREGVSLHDTTGKHQRAEYNLGMPTKPVAAIQIEGRIYRTGQASDALFRYMTTGTAWEAAAFGSKIAERASTAENLALGTEARGLKQAFIDAYQDAEYFEPSENEGTGGKAYDREMGVGSSLTPFERAKTYYYAQQKNTKRRRSREGADYYATPEPVGFKMVEWAGIKPNESVLEPSAGHGAIARFVPEDTNLTMVEPSYDLSQRAALARGDARIVNDQFEGLALTNKYDAIVMNPPYGSGGKTSTEHLAKAARHLRNGGRIVALLPRGGTATKRLDDFLGSDAAANLYTVARVDLPRVTFQRAGTQVNTQVLVLERQDNPEDAARIQQRNVDLDNAETVEALFDRLENVSLPDRVPPSDPEPAAQPELVEHVTKRGKTLRGVIRTDLTKDQAKQVDPFTFRKATEDGESGYFIRQKYLGELAEKFPMGGESLSLDGDVTDTPAFRGWFGDSKVVDENGDPLVVYHGTGEDFSTFSEDFYGEATGIGDLGEGFYFTDQADAAGDFAGTATPSIMPVYLNIQNPATNEVFRSDEVQSALDDDMGFVETREVLEALGYDGVIYDHGGQLGKEYVAFQPNQIKSATGNRGTFDPNDPDILASVGDDFRNDVADQLRQTAPVVVRTPENLRGMDLDAMRDEVFRDLMARRQMSLRNERFQPKVVRLNREGLTKSRTNSRDPAKVVAMSQLRRLIRESQFVGETVAPDGRGRFQYLAARVNIDGVPTVVMHTIRDQDGKLTYYNTTVMDDVLNPERGSLAAPAVVDGDVAAFTRPQLQPQRGMPAADEIVHRRRSVIQQLRSGPAGPLVDALLQSDALSVVYDVPPRIRERIGPKGRVQGYASRDGKITLVAKNLNPTRTNAVLLHEAFHAGAPTLLGDRRWNNLMDQMGRMMKAAERRRAAGEVKDGDFWDSALRRVENARAKDPRLSEDKAREEFAAYAIEHYESAPSGIRKWVDSLIGAIKDFLQRKFGIQLGEVTPAQLRALALAAIRSRIGGNVNTASPVSQSVAERRDDLAADAPEGTDPDVLMSIAADSVAVDEALGYDRRNRFEVPPETRGDVLQRIFQDRFNRMKTVQQALAAQNGTLTEAGNVYMAEERYHGRSTARLEDFTDNEVAPFIEAVAEADVTLDEVAEYAYAKHAPERNAYAASINERFEQGNGSGMTDQEAQAVLDEFEANGKTEALDRLHKQILAIGKGTRRLLVAEGLETAERVQGWEEMFGNYIPLKGFENVDEYGQEAPRQGTGSRGFSVTGRESKAITGRRSRASEIIENIVAQRERAIVRAEKNKVAKSLMRLVLDNPDTSLWAVNEVQRKPVVRVGDRTALEDIFSEQPAHAPRQKGRRVEYVPVRSRYDDNVVVAKVKGREVLITVKDPVLAEQLKMANATELPPGFKQLNGINRMLARLWTSLNPVFSYVNYMRDIQTAYINALGETDAKVAMATVRRAGPFGWAMRAIKQGMQGKDTEGAEWYHRYRQAGGKTGFYSFNQLEDQQKKLQKLLETAKGDRSKAMAAGRAVVDFVEDVNAIVENAVRLSSFRAGIEAGMSEAQAASFAKNLTVNFNRRGEWTHFFGSLYLFFNPAVQGTVRIAQALRSPKVQALVAGLTVANFALGLLGRAIGGEDEDGQYFYDKIPQSVRRRNMVIMNPFSDEGGYFKIPMPYGYSFFASIGDAAYNKMVAGQSAGKVATEVATAFGMSFNPVGNGTPTVFAPAIDIAVNENYFGDPIYPEPMPFQPPTPDSTKYWPSMEGTFLQEVTSFANEATGGNEVRPGVIDVSPEVVEHVFRSFTGGLGTAANDMIKVLTDPEQDVTRLPFVKQMYGTPFKGRNVNQFYENLVEAELADAEAELYRGQSPEEYEELLRTDGWKVAMESKGQRLRKRLAKERRRIDKIQASSMPEAEKREAIKQVREQMDLRTIQFNREWNRAKKAAADR